MDSRANTSDWSIWTGHEGPAVVYRHLQWAACCEPCRDGICVSAAPIRSGRARSAG